MNNEKKTYIKIIIGVILIIYCSYAGTQHNYETVDTSSEELPKKRTRPPAYTNVSLQPGDTERVYNCVHP